MPSSHLYIPETTEDAQALLEDGIGSVVIFVGTVGSSAGRAYLDAFSAVADDFDPDHLMFAHIDPMRVGTVGPELERLCAAAPGQPLVLSCRDGEVLDAGIGRLCTARLHRQVRRLLRDDPGPSLLTRLFRFASGA